MKNLKEKLKYSKKGITLIALVITIIILLILAGVSIATLTGDSGLLTKAQEAKEKTEREKIIENIQIDILAIQTINSGNISDYQLKQILTSKYGNFAESEESSIFKQTLIVQNGKYKIPVSEIYSGNLTETITGKINSNNYGEPINYSVNGISDWKIFYNDGENVFIIKENYLDNSFISNDIGMNNAEYKHITWWNTVSSDNYVSDNVLKKYLLQEYDKFYTKNNNYLATITLLNTNFWNSFVNIYAESAIGSPTLAMWINSWNEIYENNTDKKLYLSAFDNGYKIRNNSSEFDNSIELNDNSNKLFFPYSDTVEDETSYCRGYWLASPSAALYDLRIMNIDCTGGIYNNNYETTRVLGIRPVVMLKSNINAIQDENGTWNIVG